LFKNLIVAIFRKFVSVQFLKIATDREGNPSDTRLTRDKALGSRAPFWILKNHKLDGGIFEIRTDRENSKLTEPQTWAPRHEVAKASDPSK